MSAPIPPAFQSPLLNRRRFLGDTGLGLGSIALTHLLGRQGCSLRTQIVGSRFGL